MDNSIFNRMKLDRYELKAEPSLMAFEFLSEGPKGEITKIIKYSETALHGFFNLGFGDKQPGTNTINDLIISDNGDSEKVLATVVASLYSFTARYPNAWVYATGSSKSRTRLYRMGIAKYLAEMTADFDVYGALENEWYAFERDINYTAFLAKRKNA